MEPRVLKKEKPVKLTANWPTGRVDRSFRNGLAQIGYRLDLKFSVPQCSSRYDFDDRGALAVLQYGAISRAIGEVEGLPGARP